MLNKIPQRSHKVKLHLKSFPLSELTLRDRVLYIYGCTGRAESRIQQALPQVSKWIMDVQDTYVESLPSEGCKHIPRPSYQQTAPFR